MSCRTPCNYCSLQDFKRKGKVELEASPTEDAPDAVNVFIRYPDGKLFWTAWFMKLTDHCVC